jgi:hypothetical protein
VVLDDSDAAISDGDDGSLLDELGGLTLEEGVGGSGLVGDNCADEGGLAVVALGLFGLDDAHVDVVSVPGIHQAVDLHEGGFGQLRHNVEIKYQLAKNQTISRPSPLPPTTTIVNTRTQITYYCHPFL